MSCTSPPRFAVGDLTLVVGDPAFAADEPRRNESDLSLDWTDMDGPRARVVSPDSSVFLSSSAGGDSVAASCASSSSAGFASSSAAAVDASSAGCWSVTGGLEDSASASASGIAASSFLFFFAPPFLPFCFFNCSNWACCQLPTQIESSQRTAVLSRRIVG